MSSSSLRRNTSSIGPNSPFNIKRAEIWGLKRPRITIRPTTPRRADKQRNNTGRYQGLKYATAQKFYKVMWDYDAQKSDELSLKEGQLIKITNYPFYPNWDWGMGEKIDKSKGLVPMNYLEKRDYAPLEGGKRTRKNKKRSSKRRKRTTKKRRRRRK